MTERKFQAILGHLFAQGEDYRADYEVYRDQILELSPDVMKYVLEIAQGSRAGFLLDLLVTVLADAGYPPAMPYFVEWLDHENAEVRFAAACALDELAKGRFGVQKMIQGGWVQHDKLQETIPAIKSWWEDQGRRQIPSEGQWYAQQVTQIKYTYREKCYNFVEINPTWVMLGSGPVYQVRETKGLPRNQGIHVVWGQVKLRGEEEPRPAAIELDSGVGKVSQAFIKVDGRWIDITGRAEWIQPNFGFE